MLPRRVLCTTVVFVSLTLLHWPQFAHGVRIVEVDNLGIDGSVATYKKNNRRELTIIENRAFNLTLATSGQVLSLDVQFGNNDGSTIEIVSAAHGARCKWGIMTRKSTCTMEFTVNRNKKAGPLRYESVSCNEFVEVRVDVTGKMDITAGTMKLTNLNPDNVKADVLKGLKQCKEIRPTPYNQSIYNSKRPNPSNVTYVWEIALQKTTPEQVVLRLRDMTPVQFVPDPTTTAGPNTTTAPTNNPTNGAASSSSPPEGTTGGISAATIGGIAGGVAAVLVVTIVVVVVIVYICRRRGRQSKTIPVEDQPPPEVQAAAENAPNDAKPYVEPKVIRVERNPDNLINCPPQPTSLESVVNPTDLKDVEKAEKTETAAKNDKA